MAILDQFLNRLATCLTSDSVNVWGGPCRAGSSLWSVRQRRQELAIRDSVLDVGQLIGDRQNTGDMVRGLEIGHPDVSTLHYFAKVTYRKYKSSGSTSGCEPSQGWMPSPEEFASFDAACKESAGKVLDEARAMAEQIGISAELLHVPNAHAATAIIETAKSRGCDLIVMASHGRRGLRKLFLGSQTSEVLVDGSVPVLVVGQTSN